MVTPGKMTDHEKAKDCYSIHQDNLFWSRTQTLIAIQGGTLVGAYSVHSFGGLAVPLLLLGCALTIILLIAAENDQTDRDAAFEQSKVPPLRTSPRGAGRLLMRIVFGLLLFADLWVLGWIALANEWVFQKI